MSSLHVEAGEYAMHVDVLHVDRRAEAATSRPPPSDRSSRRRSRMSLRVKRTRRETTTEVSHVPSRARGKKKSIRKCPLQLEISTSDCKAPRFLCRADGLKM